MNSLSHRTPRRASTRLFLMLVLVVGFGLGLAACADGDGGNGDTAADGNGGGDGGEDMPTVVFQVFPADPAGVPVRVMQEEGLDEANGFQAELLEVDPDAAMETFLLGESDVATEQDVVTTAIARQEGNETVAFYPVLNMITGIVVPEDSPYESPQDLATEDAQVGHFGVDSGTTTGIALALNELHDLDIYEEYNLTEAGPEALPELLAGGEVDAILDYQPLLVRAVNETPGRYLFNPYNEWAETHDGWGPWLTNLTARKEWLDEDPDRALAVRDAFEEAQQMIVDSDFEILREDTYAEWLNLRDDAEVDGFVEYCQEVVPCYTTEWTEDDLAQAENWVELMHENELLIEELPEEPLAVILEDYFENAE